jgi:hypothetical protein
VSESRPTGSSTTASGAAGAGDRRPARPHAASSAPADPESADPAPADPEKAGVQPETPDAMQLEAARLLANDARDELRDRGFGDEQIDEWAKTYVAEHGSGDVPTFMAWIAQAERS